MLFGIKKRIHLLTTFFIGFGAVLAPKVLPQTLKLLPKFSKCHSPLSRTCSGKPRPKSAVATFVGDSVVVWRCVLLVCWCCFCLLCVMLLCLFGWFLCLPSPLCLLCLHAFFSLCCFLCFCLLAVFCCACFANVCIATVIDAACAFFLCLFCLL